MYTMVAFGAFPGGYSCEFLVVVCRPGLQILALFHTKECRFSLPFSDLASKIHTRFQNWRKQKLCYHY